ncbi:hypothetical protein GCM10025331_69550 [Actinoplanes utahensis]|nr:hypothetical protein Aut01nite_73690 [Actinoplanes utahensis]
MLERPDAGTVTVGGLELTALGGKQLRIARHGIGMIHQHFALLSSRTVAGNVAFALEVIGTPRAERKARVAELLELVGLTDRAEAYPAQLSGGQKQRVGIARALAARPRVLLSDEATSALDPETTDSILRLLLDLNRRLGLTILLITHEMTVVKRICTSAAVMRDGRFVESGTIADLLRRPDSELARDLFPLDTATTAVLGSAPVRSGPAAPQGATANGVTANAATANGVTANAAATTGAAAVGAATTGAATVGAATTGPATVGATAAGATAVGGTSAGAGVAVADGEVTIVDITVSGPAADEPIIAELARRFDVDVRILGGSVETLATTRAGRWRLALPGRADDNRAALEYLRERGVTR